MRAHMSLAVPVFSAFPQTAFQAASLEPANSGAGQRRPAIAGGPGTSDRGRIRYSGISLRDLILLAYRIHAFQISPSGAEGLDDRTFPDIFSSLRQQLGLQLGAAEAQVEVPVIDRFDQESSETRKARR